MSNSDPLRDLRDTFELRAHEWANADAGLDDPVAVRRDVLALAARDLAFYVVERPTLGTKALVAAVLEGWPVLNGARLEESIAGARSAATVVPAWAQRVAAAPIFECLNDMLFPTAVVPNASLYYDRTRRRLKVGAGPAQDWDAAYELWNSLMAMVDSPGRLVRLSKGDLSLWRESRVPELRDKLGKDAIQNVRGTGYKLTLQTVPANLQA